MIAFFKKSIRLRFTKQPEIKIGQIWINNTTNPFNRMHCIIDDYKDGWVKYRFGSVEINSFRCESTTEEEVFRHMYDLKE